jgi:hypothetical protein
MKAICQICGEAYANLDLSTLRYPLTGAMFLSPDTKHGVPAPFDPSLDWEFMRCPFGRIHRPIIEPDAVLTNKGLFRLPEDGGPAFLDPTAPQEIDRSGVGDQVLQVSDEEAERMARAGIPGPKDPSELTTPFTSDGNQPQIDPRDEMKGEASIDGQPREPSFACPACGKEFDTEKKLKGHIMGAHRRKK